MTLTYKDSDGDKVLIHSRDDLLAAMRERFAYKKLKVLASVQKNEHKPASRARLTSVESATQTSTSTTAAPATDSNIDHRPPSGQEQPQPHSLPVVDAVEAILGILAGATSAVQAHLQEATAPDRRVETTAPAPATTESPPVVTTAESTTGALPSVRSSTRYCLEDEEEDAAKEETDPQEKKEEDAKPFIHGRHTCDGKKIVCFRRCSFGFFQSFLIHNRSAPIISRLLDDSNCGQALPCRQLARL